MCQCQTGPSDESHADAERERGGGLVRMIAKIDELQTVYVGELKIVPISSPNP